MENESPIKAWVRKHSPLKSRFATNKPLPPAPPREESPVKDNALRPATAETVTKGPNKFLSFLKSKTQHDPQPEPLLGESTTPKRKRGAFASLTSRDGAHRSPIRKSLRRQPSVDLNKLSQKVSSLEAQLREARKELDTVVGKVKIDDSTNSEKINQAVAAKQQSLVAGDRYNGLVETLLGQTSPSYTQHTLRSSANLPSVYAEYLAIEELFEEPGGFVDTTPRLHKRKRETSQEQQARSRLGGGFGHDLRQHPQSVQDQDQPPTRREADDTKELPCSPPGKSSDGNNDLEPTSPTSRRPIQTRTEDLTVRRPNLPPPRLDSLPLPRKTSLRQPRKPQRDTSTSRVGIVYEECDVEYTSSGSSSPFTPPAALQENVDPASSSPFHESPTPRSALATPIDAALKTPAASPKTVALTPLKRHVQVPATLDTVDEEFEWNDEEIF